VRRRHVEHDDIGGMVGGDRVEVAAMDGVGPALDDGPDAVCVVHAGGDADPRPE
jgi:hypothetical protein